MEYKWALDEKTSERTLKTEQERIKHNVNESLEINRKQKRTKYTKLSEEKKDNGEFDPAQDERSAACLIHAKSNASLR